MSRTTALLGLALLTLLGGCKKQYADDDFNDAYESLQKHVSEKVTEDGLLLVEVDLDKDEDFDVYNYYRELTKNKRLLVRKEVDSNRDGRIDIISKFDDQGDLQTEDMDRDFNGTFDWTDHYQNGRRVMSEVDSDSDGTADIFSYYNKGKITRKERDRDNDGRIDYWERYDEDGLVIKTGADTDGDGKMDVREE